jgi:hypothetical protein
LACQVQEKVARQESASIDSFLLPESAVPPVW